ncbi:MAG: SPOR domain-containing protein [Crocinitomicaceae bacterium]|nr:SPOR domain-containing protein [Crocinitomicaceae bacterium]
MDKYLLEILKESNTIIIPGLGALTITNKATGETMFMPYLQHDDGKLAAFIAENDGIDEADAKNMVAKYVREIKAELDKGESYSMFELGTFKKKDDGDVEFENWKNATEKNEEVTAPVAAPIVEAEPVVEDEPIVDEAPEVEPEPIAEPEPEVEPEAISEPVPNVEPEPEVVPEPVVEPEPVAESEPEAISEPEPAVEPEAAIEPEPIAEPEPVVKPEPPVAPEPIDVSEKETEIRETITETFNAAEVVEEFIPEKTTLEPSPLLDDIAPTSAVALDPEIDSTDEVNSDEESGEEEEKKKAGAGFWITIIIVALGIIAGGAYVGRNFNDIKQYFAGNDEEAEKNSLKDEISNEIKEDKYGVESDGESKYEGSSDTGEEGFMDEGDGNDEGSSQTIDFEPEPKPEVIKPEVKKPAPVTVSSSSGGPYKVIAGAFSSEANAKRLAAEFKSKGMNSEVFMKGELHAVSMQSYPTSEAANAELSKLQSMAPGAWIYYKR